MNNTLKIAMIYFTAITIIMCGAWSLKIHHDNVKYEKFWSKENDK